ncbi:hypothetical protein I7I48_10041 [Histoplasma ohiense]|nr:hypothetical protein I7I48_10041 [Histoplasma ohiense (nom. inval.)]
MGGEKQFSYISQYLSVLNQGAEFELAKTQSVHDIIGRLKSAPGGYKHVADDGVIRSFGPDGAVVDTARLTNAQLMKTVLDHYDPDARKHLEEIWSGVDGRNGLGQSALCTRGTLAPSLRYK